MLQSVCRVGARHLVRRYVVDTHHEADSDRHERLPPKLREKGCIYVLGCVSFRGDGDSVTMEVLHRADANFFPGRLAFKGVASVRAGSFACRTIPEPGEQILNFADGAGDSPCNDSVSAKNAAVCIRHGGLFLV